MNLVQYLEAITAHSYVFQDEGRWYDEIVKPWITDIAPVKTYEYGIECWQRLGSRGLLVDINACYYRWDMLRIHDQNGQSLTNALIDLYGYSAMFCVCLADEHHMRPLHFYDSKAFRLVPPSRLNDWLIEHLWENEYTSMRVLNTARTIATHLAKAAWEEFH